MQKMWKILYFWSRVIYLSYNFFFMKKWYLILMISVMSISSLIQNSYAAPCAPWLISQINNWVETCVSPSSWASDNILGISTERLRNGDITVSDIPKMIVSIIAFLLGLAGSISVVALIYHAVKMQLASGITGDSSWVDKAKKWMKWALLGFVLAMSAWFLMTKFIELLSSAT